MTSRAILAISGGVVAENRTVCGFLCQEMTVAVIISLEGCIVLLYELAQPRIELQKS